MLAFHRAGDLLSLAFLMLLGAVSGCASDGSASDSAGISTPSKAVVDTIAPVVSITSPTSSTSYTTTTNAVTLNGSATDKVGVTQVTWTNSAGGSGTASGTTTWS